MSVVGIDFGNANNVVALARRKGIDVVLNDESKRETPSMLNFGEKQVRDLSEEGRGKTLSLEVKRENAFMTDDSLAMMGSGTKRLTNDRYARDERRDSSDPRLGIRLTCNRRIR